MRFSNSYRSHTRIQGRDGTIEGFGGEGASLYLLTREGGKHEMDMPRYTSPPTMGLESDKGEILKVAGAPEPNTHGPGDNDVDHLMNWLNAMRDRKVPNANVDHGFSHAIACIMATDSLWLGKRMYWDPATEAIVGTPV